MQKMLRLCAVFLAVLGLLAQPVAAAKDPVKVSNGKLLSGTQKIAIGQFTVAFLIERKDNASAGGGLMGGGFGGKSTVRSQLEGVTRDQMQAVADAAYADFVAQLSARGFEVVDRANLATDMAAFAGPEQFVEKTLVVGKDDKARALFVGASQTGPLRFLDSDYHMAGIGDIASRQAAWKLAAAQQQYAKQTGVKVVNVIYAMNFAASDEYGGWFRSTSSVKVDSSLGLAPGVTKVTVYGDNAKPAQLVLEQPVGVGGDYLDRADAMGGGEKAVRAVTKVIGVLGGLGSNSYKKLTFTARPGAYPDAAVQATSQANAGFAERLAALR